MFWKEAKGLKDIPKSSRIAITAFLILTGISYIFGFLNIYFTYNLNDKEKGLSINDVRIAYYGAREGTKLEKAIDGTMKEYFTDDEEYNSVKGWISTGAKEDDFPAIKEIFENSCVVCHSSDYKEAGVSLESYEDTKPYLKEDTGKSTSRLISLSHTHLFSIVTVLFILTFIFSFSSFSEKFKKFIFGLAFFAAAFDIGSWWLAKSSGALAFLVIIAGVLVGISFLLLVLLPLYEMWIKKRA